MNNAKNLAQKLRECMEANGTSPPDLARLCGVKTPSVYDWMEYGRIAKRHIPKLAAYFGTSLSFWLGAEEDEEELDPLERQLLTMYRAMSEPFRDRLLQDANHLLNLQDPTTPTTANPFATPKPKAPKSED